MELSREEIRRRVKERRGKKGESRHLTDMASDGLQEIGDGNDVPGPSSNPASASNASVIHDLPQDAFPSTIMPFGTSELMVRVPGHKLQVGTRELHLISKFTKDASLLIQDDAPWRTSP